jgi:hypothetical protein
VTAVCLVVFFGTIYAAVEVVLHLLEWAGVIERRGR